MALIGFRAPALPLPRQEYDRQQMDQLINALRLYFNQLDSLTPQQANSYRADEFIGGDFSGDDYTGDVFTGNTFNGTTLNGTYFNGGSFSGEQFNGGVFNGSGHRIIFPHIAASDSTDQIAGGDNTPTVVKWNTLDSGYGWTLNSPGSATADFAGVYKITFRLQFINTANAIHYATAWVKVNGVDIVNTATIFTIPGRKSASPGEEGFLSAYSEITFSMQIGDEVELYWATDLAGNPTTPTNGVFLLHDGAQVSPFARPAIASAIGSIAFVSALPDVTVQPSIDTLVISGSAPTVTVA
jgi:hypothetical protein